MENEEICTISIGNGILDDDYTFFVDGKIKRLYDKSNFSYNITEWVTEEKISESKKSKILKKCTEDKKQLISQILNL